MRIRIGIAVFGCCALLVGLGLVTQLLRGPRVITLQAVRDAPVTPEELSSYVNDLSHFSQWSPWERPATGSDSRRAEPAGQPEAEYAWEHGQGIQRGRVKRHEKGLPLRLQLRAERPQLGQGELRVDLEPANLPDTTRVSLTLQVTLSPLHHLLSPILRPEPRLRSDLERAVERLANEGERVHLEKEWRKMNAALNPYVLRQPTPWEAQLFQRMREEEERKARHRVLPLSQTEPSPPSKEPPSQKRQRGRKERDDNFRGQQYEGLSPGVLGVLRSSTSLAQEH